LRTRLLRSYAPSQRFKHSVGRQNKIRSFFFVHGERIAGLAPGLRGYRQQERYMVRSRGNVAIMKRCIQHAICKPGGPSLRCKFAGSQHTCRLARERCSLSCCSSCQLRHRAPHSMTSVGSQLHSSWSACVRQSRCSTSNCYRPGVGSFVSAFQNQSQCVKLIAHANTSPSCWPAAQQSIQVRRGKSHAHLMLALKGGESLRNWICSRV